MTVVTFDSTPGSTNPLDMIEEAVFGDEWPCERTADDELLVTVKGNWCDYQIAITWRDDMGTLHLACAFDAGLPKNGLGPERTAELYVLAGKINEQLLLGHFDMWQEESSIVFRQGVLVHGGATGPEQWECLLHIAVETCERYYPAFQFVLWGGKSAQNALDAAMVETVGEA